MHPNATNQQDTISKVQAFHQLYCQLTGQTLPLHSHRQRMWAELVRAGYTLDDLKHLVGYLQREIRAGRRNVGALKLSNLLQPDRFEEDLQISRVRLSSPPTARPPKPPVPGPMPDPVECEQARRKTLEFISQLRQSLR